LALLRAAECGTISEGLKMPHRLALRCGTLARLVASPTSLTRGTLYAMATKLLPAVLAGN